MSSRVGDGRLLQPVGAVDARLQSFINGRNTGPETEVQDATAKPSSLLLHKKIIRDASSYKNNPDELHSLFPQLAKKLDLKQPSPKGVSLSEVRTERICDIDVELEKLAPYITMGIKEFDGVLGLCSDNPIGYFMHPEKLDSFAKSFGMDADMLLANIIGVPVNIAEHDMHSNLFLGLPTEMARESVGPLFTQDSPSILLPINGCIYTDEIIRNTVTMHLDGSPEQILRNYLMVMAHLRLWFVSRCIQIDLSSVVGYEKLVYVVPDDGTFHLVLKHKDKSAALVIDAREAWLHGGAGAHAITQFSRDDRVPYISHEYTITLEAGGQYKSVAKKGAGEVPIGAEPLIEAASVIHDFKGQISEQNTSSATLDDTALGKELKIYDAYGVIVLHLLDPLKFHVPFEIVCSALGNGTVTTLNKEDPTAAVELKKWGKIGEDIGKYSFMVLRNRSPKPLDLSKRGVEGVNTIHDALDRIFLMPWAFLPTSYLEHQTTMPFTGLDSRWNPVDVGKGDTIPLERLYEKVRSRIGSGGQNWQDTKFIRDREHYFGDRLGGRPCDQSVRFLRKMGSPTKQESTNFSSIWKTKLPVQGRELRNIVQFASRVTKFVPK